MDKHHELVPLWARLGLGAEIWCEFEAAASDAQRQRSSVSVGFKTLEAVVHTLRHAALHLWPEAIDQGATLYLHHLSAVDFQAFKAVPFEYSGSTGAGGTAGGAEHLGSYIATYWRVLPHALKCFGWRDVAIEHAAGAWYVRKVI